MLLKRLFTPPPRPPMPPAVLFEPKVFKNVGQKNSLSDDQKERQKNRKSDTETQTCYLKPHSYHKILLYSSLFNSK